MSGDAFLHLDPFTSTDSDVRPRVTRFTQPSDSPSPIKFAYTSQFIREKAHFPHPLTSSERPQQLHLPPARVRAIKTEKTNPRLLTLTKSNIINKMSMLRTNQGEHQANINFSHVSKNNLKFAKKLGKFTPNGLFPQRSPNAPEPGLLPRQKRPPAVRISPTATPRTPPIYPKENDTKTHVPTTLRLPFQRNRRCRLRR